jgi:predicted SprT family Zn-dependent metalloprotease
MADLRVVESFAREMMREHNLVGWTFQYDNATKRFGVCKYTKRVIGMSKRLTLANDEAQAMDTVLHEIAHALVGYGHGHGPVWKAKAREIGAVPKACVASTEVVLVGKYKGYCAFCGPQHRIAQDRRPTRQLACKMHNETIQWRDAQGNVVDPTANGWEAVCPDCGPLNAMFARKPNRNMKHNACGSRVTFRQKSEIFA